MFILRRVFKYKCDSAKELLYEGGTIWLDPNKDPFKEKEEAKRLLKEKKMNKQEEKE
jgi:hypothetical protein